jgi:hypothetical protein
MIPIPPDYYSSASDAMSRARDNGDPMTALDRLRGLLIFGKLKAWSVDHHMNLSECPPDMWKDRRNNHLLTEPDEMRVETEDRNVRIVFLTADLDKVLPTAEEQAERHRSPPEVPVTSRHTAKHPGGAPNKYDWEGMLIEAARIMCDQKKPRNIAALRKRLREWFADKTSDGGPDDKMFNAKTARFWKEVIGD